MKWGVRRYQNADGSLTSAGKKRQAELNRQASKYDDKALEFARKAKIAKAKLGDLNKNGKNSKYYEELLNPDDRATLSNAKKSGKLDVDLYNKIVEINKKVAENIRNTEFGKKSIEEIANRKDLISKGKSRAVAAAGITLTAVMYNKKLIGKGQAAAMGMLTGVASGMTRLNTYGNVYNELRKQESTATNLAGNKKKKSSRKSIVNPEEDDRIIEDILKRGYNYSPNNI